MLFFCSWVSHVMLIRVFASVSYILRLCTGYLPGTVFLFFFRFSITMQEKLHLFFYSASGLFFLFSFLSFFLFFFFFFLQRARSFGLNARAFQTDANIRAGQFSLKSFSKLWAKFISKAKASLKRRRYAYSYGPLCSILKFPLLTQPPPPTPHAGVIIGAYTGAVL